MNSEQKKQTAQKIVEQSKSYIKILHQYIEAMANVFSTNEEELIHTLISIHGNKDSHWQKQLKTAKESASLCPELVENLTNIAGLFQDKGYVQTLVPQYLQLVNIEISSATNINNLAKWLPTVSQSITSIYDETIDYNTKRNTAQNLTNILSQPDGFALRFLQRLAQLDTFKHFSSIDHSVVIVGANGSGKSSFSRNTKKVLGGNVVIISAQKIFTHHQIKNIPLAEEALQNVYKFQLNEKLGKNWGNQIEYGQDLHYLMLSLISEHNKKANEFYSGSKDGQIEREVSILERTMHVWEEIINHRYMRYEAPNIRIHTHSKEVYDFPYLSDGEKAIFYYISHILIAKENSFIIVDEPENHLHMGVVAKLWDKLEILRDDCKFIYLTHNLDFASSRIQATKFWNKSFTPPAEWDVVPLPCDQDLPESLLMELLGSRKKILFCEGEKSSPDYKLYTLLFPEYTIKPVGGHFDVITFTRAFNKSRDIFGNSAIGIIDGDFHSEGAKSKWESDCIYCIEAQEVENILCDTDILDAAQSCFCFNEEELSKAKNLLFKELENNKERQAVEYATHRINNALKSSLIEKPKTKDELKKQFSNSIKSINIDELIEERIRLFQKIINEKDFDMGIKYYNNKGISGLIGGRISQDYKNRIFRLLEKQPELRKKLREKYFSKVPCNQIGGTINV